MSPKLCNDHQPSRVAFVGSTEREIAEEGWSERGRERQLHRLVGQLNVGRWANFKTNSPTQQQLMRIYFRTHLAVIAEHRQKTCERFEVAAKRELLVQLSDVGNCLLWYDIIIMAIVIIYICSLYLVLLFAAGRSLIKMCFIYIVTI